MPDEPGGGCPVLSIYLVCVGRLKERFYQDACAEYLKRLSPYCKLTLLELPEERLPQSPSQGQIDAALEKEGQACLLYTSDAADE